MGHAPGSKERSQLLGPLGSGQEDGLTDPDHAVPLDESRIAILLPSSVLTLPRRVSKQEVGDGHRGPIVMAGNVIGHQFKLTPAMPGREIQQAVPDGVGSHSAHVFL